MKREHEKKFKDMLGDENVLIDEPMSAHTTFRVGGPADYYVTPTCIDDVKAVVDFCRSEGLKLYTIGCGSNVLVSDEGLRGAVMKIGPRMAEIETKEDGRITAQAGTTNAKIAHVALEYGLTGFEFAAGIPGSIGGAAIMNAGAYGGELRDVATSVTCLTKTGEVVTLSAEEADWSYRHSKMADDGSIILSVSLKLSAGDPASIKTKMVELAQKRTDKQPLDLPSAGSTFKRPEGHFAGKLIQDAGMQGYTVGGAQVSTKHAGFVVNVGDATASDVIKVIDDVRAAVRDQFGITLEPEVRCWGF